MVLSDVANAIRRGDTRRCRTQRIELTRQDVSSKLIDIQENANQVNTLTASVISSRIGKRCGHLASARL